MEGQSRSGPGIRGYAFNARFVLHLEGICGYPNPAPWRLKTISSGDLVLSKSCPAPVEGECPPRILSHRPLSYSKSRRSRCTPWLRFTPRNSMHRYCCPSLLYLSRRHVAESRAKEERGILRYVHAAKYAVTVKIGEVDA